MVVVDILAVPGTTEVWHHQERQWHSNLLEDKALNLQIQQALEMGRLMVLRWDREAMAMCFVAYKENLKFWKMREELLCEVKVVTEKYNALVVGTSIYSLLGFVCAACCMRADN